MTKVLTEYEKDKQYKKQKLVRNEFLYYGNSGGKYDFPIIKKQDIDVNEINFLSFVNAKKDDKENHGIGLMNIIETIERNQGKFEIEGNGKEVCARVILPIKVTV